MTCVDSGRAPAKLVFVVPQKKGTHKLLELMGHKRKVFGASDLQAIYMGSDIFKAFAAGVSRENVTPEGKIQFNGVNVVCNKVVPPQHIMYTNYGDFLGE